MGTGTAHVLFSPSASSASWFGGGLVKGPMVGRSKQALAKGPWSKLLWPLIQSASHSSFLHGPWQRATASVRLVRCLFHSLSLARLAWQPQYPFLLVRQHELTKRHITRRTCRRVRTGTGCAAAARTLLHPAAVPSTVAGPHPPVPHSSDGPVADFAGHVAPDVAAGECGGY